MSDTDAPEKIYEEGTAEIWQHVPVRVRLRGLKPEEWLEGLTPDQRLEGLTPDQRLEGLTPDQIVAALKPDAREELARKLRH